MALAALLPWVQATIPFAGSITRNGIDSGGDGLIIIVLAIAIGLIGFGMYTDRVPLDRWSVIAGLGALGVLVTAVDVVTVHNRVNTVDPQYRGLFGLGPGLPLALLGSVIAVDAALRIRRVVGPSAGISSAPRRQWDRGQRRIFIGIVAGLVIVLVLLLVANSR